MTKTIGFIGFGRVVKWHLKQLENVDFKVEFVLDIDHERLNEAKNLLSNISFFSSYEELFKDHKCCNVDFIVIATPSGSHFKVGEILARNTLSTLVFEKPVFLNANHYIDSKKWDKYLIPIFQNRYNESVIKALEIINSGQLGDLIYATLNLDWIRPQRYYDQSSWRGTWENDGGVSTNQGIHYFDIVRHLLGGFYSVNAYMRKLAANIECEDYFTAFFELQNGLPLDVRMTTAMRCGNEEASLKVHGSKGFLELKGVCCNKLSFTNSQKSESFYGGDVEMAYGYGHQVFYKILNGQNENNLLKIPSMEEAFETMKFIYSCYSSAINKKTAFNTDNFYNSPLGRKSNEIIKF